MLTWQCVLGIEKIGSFNNMSINNMKSPINYFPLKVGNTELKKIRNTFSLHDINQKWMGYNLENKENKENDWQAHWQAREFFIELELAYGKCVTSGLGLGVIQTLLAEKDNVTEVIVYEKNPDVIEMFKILAEKSNIDTSKIVIINEDANNIKNITCDCLFLDHFEYEPFSEIEETVKRIASQNTINIVWFWPAWRVFSLYCIDTNKEINENSFLEWTSTLNISKFPNQIPSHLFDNLIEFINPIWDNLNAPNKHKIEANKQKNELINFFKKRNTN